MWTILGTKLVTAFIIIFGITAAIISAGLFVNYVPFLRSGFVGELGLTVEAGTESLIRLFSIAWNCSIAVVLISFSQLAAILNAGFTNRWRWSTVINVGIYILLFYLYVWG